MMDDLSKEDFVITFDGLFTDTDFMKKTYTILKTLEQSLDTPVDIEFASDGEDFYLLQCRPQSYSSHISADEIPQNVPTEKLLFSAHKHVSNGRVRKISYIVYVDPKEYGRTHG